MAENKTRPTQAEARAFVDSLADPARRRDCLERLEPLEPATGASPQMRGGSIVGFGTHAYRYASGRSGTWFREGFSPRKQALTLYLTVDFQKQGKLLAQLGKHKRGKSCLHVRRPADLDRAALQELILRACGQGSDSSRGGAHAPA